MDGSVPISLKSESLCKVCGDKASGKHYGVASCDGCRGFFKRSIRRYSFRNLEYVCKENGQCIVDVTRRNQCQACRFRKCLQVNMKRDAVQHERAPRSTHHPNILHYPLNFGPRLRTLHNTGFFMGLPVQAHSPIVEQCATSVPSVQGCYVPHGVIYPHVMAGYSTKPTMISGIPTNNNYTQKLTTTLVGNLGPKCMISMKDDEVSSSEEIHLRNSDDNVSEDAKNRIHLPILNETPRTNTRPLEIPYLSLFPAENVYESAAKLLFIAIKWARTIPSFLQLSYRDQSLLLEESWSELFVLTSAQWALPVDEALLIGNAMAPTSRHNALEEDARRLREIITRLTLLRVDHTEYACLKALVLFKAECRGLCEPSHVELLQDQTHVMLHEYCVQRQSVHKGRFGKLLLTLPSIQAVTKRGLEELLFRQTVGDVAVDRLLRDLAKVVHNT